MKKRDYKYIDGELYLKCTCCSLWKSSWDYHKLRDGLFWFRAECKDCVRNRCKARYNSKRDEISAQNKQYYWDNKEKINEHKREYYKTTYKRTNYSSSLTEKLWFNRQTFHERARSYARKHWLFPSTCTICGWDEKIEIHHPSYNSFDEWSKVVFCCHSCHKRIHSWNIKNPQPINLLDTV